VRVNISDVRDTHSMRYLVRGQDYLFNLAGQTSHMDSMDDPYTDLEIKPVAALDPGGLPQSQPEHQNRLRQHTPDLRQAGFPAGERRPLAGESYHILYNNVLGIRACALRLTNTYGPRMRVKDARQTFLGV
jgi:UDP-glucose 4-epimerase